MSRLLLVLLSISLFQMNMAVAQVNGEPGGLSQESGWIVSTDLGFLILSEPTNTTASGITSFAANFRTEHYFTRNVGLFFGADYSKRGFSSLTGETSAGFIDIPFGLAFNHGSSFFSNSSSRTTTQIGGYYAVPLKDYSGDDVFEGAEPNSQSYFGIAMRSTQLFEVSPSFALGFSLWLKWGLGDATDYSITNRFLDMGLGLTAAVF